MELEAGTTLVRDIREGRIVAYRGDLPPIGMENTLTFTTIIFISLQMMEKVVRSFGERMGPNLGLN